MSREYPDWVDPWKAAEGRRSFGGSMPLGRMDRLLPLLDPPVGEARFTAQFGFDDQQQVVIHIEVDADLPLICQRSLGRYLEPVHRESVLGVMGALEEESLLPGDYEPVLAEQGRLALQDLVEDELLLGVPQVPRDPSVPEVQVSVGGAGRSVEAPGAEGGTAPAARPEAGPEPESVRRPFADLAERMERERKKQRGGSQD